ncbi:helix-turn-helix domain-containing protein [Ornithinibacillus sp. 4-3]|uniref:Helix-turn-helix domain-containing protein n=1 Tax=Ornithinibacillus sp. 4-3 TaxID=3231488 RepID=A0AB39HHR9_9BACI
MEHFSRILRSYREELKKEDSKWTQRYVAEKIGVARVTYTAYENGTKTPPLDVVLQIASVFNVSVDYLIGRTRYTELLENIIAAFNNDPTLEKWYLDLPYNDINSLRKLKRIYDILQEEE